jgi:hypothetical protein
MELTINTPVEAAAAALATAAALLDETPREHHVSSMQFCTSQGFS